MVGFIGVLYFVVKLDDGLKMLSLNRGLCEDIWVIG